MTPLSISCFRYNSTVRRAKFYKKGTNQYMNVPASSVMFSTLAAGKTFTYNTMSGIPPKLNIEFINKIDLEAIIIFQADVEFQSDALVIVDGCIR